MLSLYVVLVMFPLINIIYVLSIVKMDCKGKFTMI